MSTENNQEDLEMIAKSANNNGNLTDDEMKGTNGKIEEVDPVQVQSLLGPMVSEEPGEFRGPFQVYRLRWIVLTVVALLNSSNNMSWIAFAPIANYVDEFYHQQGAANWFSLVFVLGTIPIGLIGMWSSRRFGLRSSILIAAWFNGVGGAIRLISSWIDPSSRFIVALIGQCVSSCAYPFIMFLPTKVAGAWFGENQRAMATTVAAMSNPLGVLLANLVSPQLVENVKDVVLVNAFTFVPCAVACVLATLGVRSSDPPTPPTASASKQQMAFFPGLAKLFTSRAFLVLLVVMGGGMGMFNTLYTIMQQLLCPKGYSNSFSGLCTALMIVGGLIGATASSTIVDRTKKYVETMKISYALAVICGIAFVQFTLRPSFHAVIVVLCILFGAFGLATFPVGLELGAESTFPVAETSSTGIITISGQIQSTIYITLMSRLSQPLHPSDRSIQVCSVTSADADGTVQARDMTIPALTFSVVGVVLACFLLLFFKPKYRRLRVDRGENEKNPNNAENGKALEETEIKMIEK